MRSLVMTGLLLCISAAQAEMISSSSIDNDPEKLKLCESRAKGKSIPFEIDSNYVARARQFDPDTTFIAVDGISPQLIECRINQGSGKFSPVKMSPEQSYWRLPRPKQFEPGINTREGQTIAAQVCLDAAPQAINKPNFDHIIQSAVVEINNSSPKYRAGATIAGKKADRYDIAVEGTSFYKTSGVDLKAIKFTCLLSPMLDIKAIKFK